MPMVGQICVHFSRYELKENEIPFDNDEISNIKIFYKFENLGLYPDNEQLDLLVKDYLKNIEPDLSFPEELELRKAGFSLIKDNIYSFFYFHLNNYEGDVYTFIKRCIEITEEIWSISNVKNIKRKKYFDSWLSETIEVYDLDVEKINPDNLEVNNTNNETGLPFNLSKINAQSTNKGVFEYFDSELYSFLDDNLYKYNGNVYEYIKNIIDLKNKNWDESLTDITRKKILDLWLFNVINKHNLDRSKLGLEPVTTPEPAQPQIDNITQPIVKIRWNGNNNVLSDIFIQLKLINNQKGEPLIPNSDNDLAVFLKSNFTCFENTSLATIEKTLSNSKQGKRPHKDKRIDINRTDL